MIQLQSRTLEYGMCSEMHPGDDQTTDISGAAWQLQGPTLCKPLVFLGTLCTISSGDTWVRKEANYIRTYLFKISPRSFWSSREWTERSEILTVAEAVRVTSRTRWPSPSSSCNSSLWVCSLLRDDRSTWHLETNVLN